MSALPSSKYLGEWGNLEALTDEAFLDAAFPGDCAEHSPGTTSPGSSSSSATTIDTPQSGSTGLHSAGIRSNARHEPTTPERREYFSEHSPSDYDVFPGSSENANGGGADAEVLQENLAPRNIDCQLGEQSSIAQLGHGFPGAFPEEFLPISFSDRNDSEAPSSQLGTLIHDGDVTCLRHLFNPGTNEQHYQYSTPHVVARLTQDTSQHAQPWGQLALDQTTVGAPTYEQRNGYLYEEFPSSDWIPNMSNNAGFPFSPQHQTPFSFHTPEEPQLALSSSMGASLSIGLGYDVNDESEILEGSSSNFCRTKETPANTFQDFQSQSESTQRPHTERESSSPIRTKGTSLTAQKGSSRNVNKSGPLSQRRRPKQRGAFTDLVERMETGETRKRKACLRCRMQRIRCHADPHNAHGTCITCQGVTNPTQSKLPCLRYKISDTALFDKGPHPQFIWCQRWKEMKIVEIKEWELPDVKTIELTQDVGDATYKVNVRKFIPVEGDSLERKWTTNGRQQSHRCATYAIANMKETGQQMLKFVDENINTTIGHYIGDSDELLQETYRMAYRHSEIAEREKDKSLLRTVLKLWVAIRMESRSERICGKEHLGMAPQTLDPSAANYNQVLVPPVMSAQIELIMTAIVLHPLKREVLKQLQELMKADRKRSWLTIYLCLFVLLHSCALLTSFENKQAKKYGLQSRYVYGSFVEELHTGSNIMLAHFHYMNKGSFPFAMDWTIERNVQQAGFSSEQLEFLTKTAQLVKEKAAIFDAVKKNGECEHDFFFLSQLYDIHWQPL